MRLTKHDAEEKVKRAGIDFESVYVDAHGRTEIKLEGRFDLHFEHLERLAAEFGTKQINIGGSTGIEGYSDVTPGSAGYCTIFICPEPTSEEPSDEQ